MKGPPSTKCEKVLIEVYYFRNRPEKSLKKFNLLTLSDGEVWDIVVYYLTNYLQLRYAFHEVTEEFELEKSLKGIETGTVKYYLNITVQNH